MYTHKVNIPYYNVYTSFWDTLYTYSSRLVLVIIYTICNFYMLNVFAFQVLDPNT
jgi:hypothetical protein